MPIKRRIFKKGQSSSRFLDKSGVGNKQNRFITSNNEYNDKNGSKAKAAVVTALATTALVGTTAVYYYTSKPEDKITKTEKEAVLYARSLQATDSTTFQLSNCGDLDVDKNKRQINLTMLDGNSLGTIGTINPEGTIEIQTNDGNRNYKIVYYTNQEDDQYVKIDYQSGMVTTLLKEGSTDVTAKIFNDDESEVY